MRKICAISLTTFVFSTIATAQLPSGGDAFFSYSYVHGEAFSHSRAVQASGGTARMSGWEVSAEGKYLSWLGVVADLDWHYGGHNTTSCAPGGVCTTFRLNASNQIKAVASLTLISRRLSASGAAWITACYLLWRRERNFIPFTPYFLENRSTIHVFRLDLCSGFDL